MILGNYNIEDKGRVKDLLQKNIFTSAENSGGALIPPHLAEAITHVIFEMVPELDLLSFDSHDRDKYQFDRITKLPAAGSASGEAANIPVKSPKVEKDFVTMKIFLRQFGITGFLRAMTRGFNDAQLTQMTATLQAMGYDMRTYFMWGNAGADIYTFDGWETMIKTNRIIKPVGGVVPTDFSELDNLINATDRKGAGTHPRAFLMSPEMLTKISSFFTTIRDTRDAYREGTSASTIKVTGGVILDTYKHIPLIATTATRPVADMTAIGVAHSGTGTIPDDTRYFQVAPVTVNGVQIASPEVSDTSVSSAEITVSWTAFEDAYLYYIYAGDTAGASKLVKIVSAFIYDTDGQQIGPNESVTFESEPLTPDPVSVPVHLQNIVPFVRTGGIPPESIYLIDLDKIQGLGQALYGNTDGSEMSGILTMEPMAKTNDVDKMMMKFYGVLVPRHELTSGKVEGLRVA